MYLITARLILCNNLKYLSNHTEELELIKT